MLRKALTRAAKPLDAALGFDTAKTFTAVIIEKKAPARNAQGIEAEIPEALPEVKLRNWSG
jgi:hypothetical protein